MSPTKQKKVLILGAGVIGVTSAYYLAKADHAVTLINKADEIVVSMGVQTPYLLRKLVYRVPIYGPKVIA